MTIQFNYQHVSGSEELENYTREKLQIIFDRYSWVTRADVFFKTENTLSAPGPRLYAEESHDTFHESVNKVVDQLKTQCEKRKATIITHS
jgi:putative sigma-54 modulation protein